MRWRGLRRSSNVDDQRGAPRAGIRGGGVGLLVIAVAVYFVAGPEAVMQLLGGQGASVAVDTPTTRGAPDEASEFVEAVLGSTEDAWGELFAGEGMQYVPPTLVLFDDQVDSACGANTSATGPFYCPPDARVYLDVGFFRDLARLGGVGDFAQAYVIGHEVGHHVQNLLGTSDRVRQQQARADQRGVNRLSVQLELQADCYAGVWAHYANRTGDVLEPGDIEEALGAAAAIGDDRLQAGAGRRVAPESFTHGSSALRAQWLGRGIEAGTLQVCDTFASPSATGSNR